MASLKKCYAKTWPLLIFIMVVMLLISTSSFYTSPPSFVMGREIPENTALPSQIKEDMGIPMKKLCKKKEEDPSPMEESAREVPTGPDPLHHNDKPIRP